MRMDGDHLNGGAIRSGHGSTQMDLSDTIGNGMSKVERYKWAKLDAPGKLIFLPKEKLTVDPVYQRDPNESKVLAIAQNFSYPAFGVLIVAERPDGVLVIVDGSNRWSAAMKRADVKRVPAIVFKSESKKMEAEAFLGANILRKPVHGTDKFKAQLVAEDPIAIEVKKLIEESGRCVGKASSVHSVKCIRLMYRLMAEDARTLNRVWRTIVAVCDGHPMHENIVAALVHIERNLPDGASLSDSRWRSRLVDIGAPALLKATHEAAAYYARGGAKVWANGALKRINRGLAEGRKLVLIGGAAE